MDATLRKIFDCRLPIASFSFAFRVPSSESLNSKLGTRNSKPMVSFPRDLNSAVRFTRPTHRHLCLESNWSRWRESNSRVRVLRTRAFPLGYTRDLWCSHRELNSDPMFKRHLRCRYAIGAWFWRRDSNSHHALIRGLRLIRPLHYQLCYAS